MNKKTPHHKDRVFIMVPVVGLATVLPHLHAHVGENDYQSFSSACAPSVSSPFYQIIKTPHHKDRVFIMVPVVGLEPTRCRHQRILSPSRLPIPSHRRLNCQIIIQQQYKIIKHFLKIKKPVT